MIKRTTLALAAMLLLGIGAISSAAYAATVNITACPFSANTQGDTYSVTANLTETTPGVSCITIGASDVAIDLQGHTITGPGSAMGFGFGITDDGNINPFTNIIIANGTIKGFGSGIGLASTYVTVSNINATQNTYGMDLNANSAVSNSQANNNSYGLIFDSGNNTISNSAANNNQGGGITINGSNNAIINTPAGGNGSDGIFITEGNNTITNSPVKGNKSGGIAIAGGNNTVTNCPVNGNGSQGIEIDGDGNFLTGDTANGNGSTGIVLNCPSNLFGNTAQGNTNGNTIFGTSLGSPLPCVELDNHGF